MNLGVVEANVLLFLFGIVLLIPLIGEERKKFILFFLSLSLICMVPPFFRLYCFAVAG